MKKIIIGGVLVLLISVILVICQVYQINESVSSSVVGEVIQELNQSLTDIRVYKEVGNKSEIVNNDSNFGNELLQRIKFKEVKRISQEEAIKISKNKSYYVEYNYGKEGFYINNDGRILITRDKGEVRNISRLHWLWWKIDNITNRTSLYYLSGPDKNIMDFIYDEVS